MKNVISQVYMIFFFCVSRMLQQKYTKSIQALKNSNQCVSICFYMNFTIISLLQSKYSVIVQMGAILNLLCCKINVRVRLKKRHFLCAKRYKMYLQTPSENFRTLLENNNWQSIHGHKTRYCCTQRFARYFLYRNKILINNYIIFDR